jgi:hypothetical protein
MIANHTSSSPKARAIDIPTPQIHIGKMGDFSHSRGGNIEDVNIIEANKQPPISIFWQGCDARFLQYNPRIFLFKYVKRNGQKKSSPREKNHSTFNHPAIYNYALAEDNFQAMFKNFGGCNIDNTAPIMWFPDTEFKKTEWVLNPIQNKFTELNNFDIRHYVKCIPKNWENPYFPCKVDEWDTQKHSIQKVTAGLNREGIKRQRKVVFKFGIVINDPNNPQKYLIGNLSNSLIVEPCSGVFSGEMKYYYKWKFYIR